MVSACPRERCYRSPQRASVIFIKMMRIFESRLFWPMAVSFLHASEGVMYSPSSNEVRFPDRRPSKYFYFENLPGRELRPDRVEQAVAEQNAKRFAREEQDKLDSKYRY